MTESFEWKLKSAQIKKRDNYSCQFCGNNDNLNVHHLFYKSELKYYDYTGFMLITLCNNCHLFEHSCYDLVGKFHHDKLVSGMLSIDIYKKALVICCINTG